MISYDIRAFTSFEYARRIRETTLSDPIIIRNSYSVRRRGGKGLLCRFLQHQICELGITARRGALYDYKNKKHKAA